METRKDLEAFETLYDELLIKYSSLETNFGKRNYDFEDKYTGDCVIGRFIRNHRNQELLRIDGKVMDYALEKLAEMERDLTKLMLTN